jgi:hypothetical protein
MSDLEQIKVQARVEIEKLEAQSSAKEVSSRYIGKSAVPWIVLLVVVGVVSAAFLPSESLSPVIGLVSTAVMALIGMLSGITGTKDKEEKPEFTVINQLIDRLDKQEPAMSVDIDGDKVVVKKGESVVTTKKVK